MREFKFRLWWNSIMCFPGDRYISEIYFDGLPWIESHGILMQWTGLKDKKGKDIYEGDILKFSHNDASNNLEVKFLDGYFGLDNKTPRLALLAAYNHKCEIVGNIYQNPELLNK